ncbi:hypothetical protein ACF0H5_000222 [Mactra antiquata]
MDTLKTVMSFLIVLISVFVFILAEPLKGFQFQCYGERFLCTFPDEYCSSTIKKCVKCSKEVCADDGKIPLSCDYVCSEDCDEEKYFIPFVVIAVILTLVIVAITLVKLIQYKRGKKPSQSEPKEPLDEQSTTVLNTLVQPSDDRANDNYCESRLKNVPPTQNPYGEYKPTLNTVELPQAREDETSPLSPAISET